MVKSGGGRGCGGRSRGTLVPEGMEVNDFVSEPLFVLQIHRLHSEMVKF